MALTISHNKRVKHPRNFPLKQLEYRSYVRTISIFHYAHHFYPISELEKALVDEKLNFVCRLESQDLFINEDGSEKLPVPEGDEVPSGFTEVVHIPNVFRNPNRLKSRPYGSALGFRLLDDDRIEWFCFDGPADHILQELRTNEGPLFELVAYLDRGEQGVNYRGRVGGYPEHGIWYESLRAASKPLLALEVVETNRIRPVKHLAFNSRGQGVEDPNGGEQPDERDRENTETDEDSSDSTISEEE